VSTEPVEPAAAPRRRIKEMEVMVADVISETPDTATLVLFTGNDRLDYQPGHFLTVDPHQFESLERFTAFLEDLKGKKVGSPEWAHSAAVYMRGWMHNEMGVKLTDVHWYQAGANAPGREEKVELNLPAGLTLTRVSDKSLSEMLASNEIDCAIIARPPTCFLEGHPDVVRLYPDYLSMEEASYARTKVWPIMHIIAMRKAIVNEHPWVAGNLYNAFLESKRRSIERILDPAVSRYPVPWLATYARKLRDTFGGDLFPYGIEENRPTWEQAALYAFQQGIAHRLMKPEELFPTGIMTKVVI